ncbi:MAG: DMT family transporter [Candidatus Hodarchaeota archaeon]
MQFYHKAQSFLFIAIIFWGVTPIFLEILLNYLTPLHAITLRFGIAVLVLTFFLVIFKRRNAFSLLSDKTCFCLGWLDAFAYLAAAIGQKMTTAGLATLISTTFVFIVPFLVWKHEGTRLDPKIMMVAFIALIGIFFISFNGDWANFSSLSYLGILLLLLAALLWAFYIVISGKFLTNSKRVERKIDPLCFLYAMLVHTFVLLIFLSMITTSSSVSVPSKIIPLLLFLAIFPTILAKALYNWAIVKIGSVRTSLYLLLQVIIPFLFEIIFFQQFYSGWVYFGTFILLISMTQIRDLKEIS